MALQSQYLIITMSTSESQNQKPKHLELPTPAGITRPRPVQTQSHLLPSTALFHGPHSRNGSHTSLHRQGYDRGHPLDTPGPGKTQHLPRAHPPTTSFSGPRPSLIGQLSQGTSQQRKAARKEDDFRADAVWAEMQKTLADVELSAMNSSHVFSSTHARALEDLRTAQLGLAQAWAKSEADEMVDDEFGNAAPEDSAIGTFSKGGFNDSTPESRKPGRRRGTSGSSAGAGASLEEETERDIRLARRRREANDRYFRQVNRGVLDVVRKLDDVAGAMRRVEKESREIWNESSGSGSDLGDATDSVAATASDTDGLTDSPDSKRQL